MNCFKDFENYGLTHELQILECTINVMTVWAYLFQ
jgi:hypothetical protein